MSSHLRLGIPKGLFPVGLPVKILKVLLLFSILATRPAHLNVNLKLIILFHFKQECNLYFDILPTHPMDDD